MKKRTRISAILLTVCLLMSAFVTTAAAASTSLYYCTAGVANGFDIEISDSTLKKAKSSIQTMTHDFVAYSSKISSPYQVNIYHFEAPASGYYSFYTTGSLDTIIKVYEEQNFLWMTTSFKDLDVDGSDDDSLADSYWANDVFIWDVDKGEDYYVVVRAYSKNTGSYTLHVEPNDDKMLTSIYGFSLWESEYGAINPLTRCGTVSKQYLTKNEVLFWYWGLDPATQDTAPITMDYICSQYNESVSKGIAAINYAISFVPGLENYGLALTAIGTIVQFMYDSTQIEEITMMNKLHDLCGAEYDFVNSKWVCRCGLRIDKFFCANTYPMYNYYYYADNSASTIRTGVAYAKGIWKN